MPTIVVRLTHAATRKALGMGRKRLGHFDAPPTWTLRGVPVSLVEYKRGPMIVQHLARGGEIIRRQDGLGAMIDQELLSRRELIHLSHWRAACKSIDYGNGITLHNPASHWYFDLELIHQIEEHPGFLRILGADYAPLYITADPNGGIYIDK